MATILYMLNTNELDLSGFSVDELESLYNKLSEVLPTKTLLDVNLEHELLLLMRKGQQLLQDVLYDPDVPANQKAQVVNSLASTLEQLTKMQVSVHDSEKIKRVEHVFSKTLKALPVEVAEFALAEYKRQWQRQFKGTTK